jgi:hypothetical protein
MQVSLLAAQNATPPADLGAATSSVTFFRGIGGSLGGALFGSILVSRLTHYVQEAVPGASQIGKTAASSGIANLPPEAQHAVLQAFISSFHDMFLLAIPFALAAFVVALFLKEAPMDRELAKGEALE